ncbi:MAG: trigger factor [Spirochaetales bacterium]|nr:trigger factor [Spirochaetales bacterium]
MAVNTEEEKKIYNAQFELKDNSRILLKITIPKEEVKKEYDVLIKDYCGKVQIKGFRKGKVPPDILKRKFGESIRAESEQNMIEKILEDVFKEAEYKPLPYAQPELNNKSDFDIEKDYTFEITYDSYPKITIEKYKDLELKKMIPDITEKDIENELKALQEQNAIIQEKKDSTVEKDNVVTIDYVEIDNDGNEIVPTKREAFSFTVGSGYNLHKIDDDIIGMKKDEEKVFEKTYESDFNIKELAGRTIKLKVKVQAVKEKKLPKLDDEFAQDVGEKYKTFSDLKKDIESRLQEAADNKVRENMISQLIEKVVKSSEIPLPKSMVESELAMRWHKLLHQYHTDERLLIKELEKQGKTKEKVLEEWKPKVEEGICSALIVEKMIELEKIEVTEEEINTEMEKLAQYQNSTIEVMKDYYEKNNLMSNLETMLSRKKLFDLLLSKAEIKKGKKIKYVDLMQENY